VAVNRPTVGRRRELDAIRRALADTAAGAGGCLLLEGPAGIGKSHLLRAAADMAAGLDIAVASREAFELDLAAPLVTLAGALRNCKPATSEFDWLAAGGTREDHYPTLERLRASLETFAGRHPLLVVVDDAHWMDELSALAVRELVPALASSPVRWLFASRPGPAESPGRQTLTWLARDWADPVRLGVLDDPAIAELCTALLGVRADDTVLALASGCGGNPLRIDQLVRALRVNGQLAVHDGVATVVGAELPASFVDTVQDILATLSPGAQWLLRAASVFARPFGLRAAARLTGRDPAELVPLVEEAMPDLLTDDSDGLVFTHDLVRQAVYSTLPRAVREQLHGEAAAAARDEGRPAHEVADHLLRAGRSGSAEAVAMLRTAARDVAGAAPATAADLMLYALRAIAPHDPERPAMIAETVGLLASAARLTEARRLGEEALRAGLDPETEALLQLGLAEAAKHAGENPTAVRYADLGLAHPGISDATRARLHAIRAHALVYADDLDAADRSGAESDRLGRAGGDIGAAVFGRTARSLVAQARGRLDDALAHARAAAELADSTGGAALHRHPRIWLGSALTCLDRFDEAEETFRRGRRESERMGTGWAQPLWHYYYAQLLAARGRLDDAVAEADAGVATAEQATAHQLAVPLLGTLARLAVLRADPDQARACLDRMRELMAAGITAPPEDVAWPEALFLDAVGEGAAAFARLAAVYDTLGDRPVLLAVDPAAAGTLTGLALTAGDGERAARVAAAARAIARATPGSPAAAGAADQAEGLLHRDPERLRAAVAAFRRTRRPLALAAALADAASAVTGADRRSFADEALAIASRCGATGLQRRIGGRGAPVPAAAFLPQLSPAERKVALLVAQGLTNLQVAERLFLSRHTVDSHLRKIFTKLGIGRRVELAARVAREYDGNPGST
jgi:ATP/maltotriose-dependent transcriptional regulator MalT